MFADEVAENSNLVVRTGVRRFPYPHLTFGCGMGKCGKCACRVIAGAEHLPEPNWKESARLEQRIAQGFRLMCQLWISHDIEIEQDDVLNAAAVRDAAAAAREAAADETNRAAVTADEVNRAVGTTDEADRPSVIASEAKQSRSDVGSTGIASLRSQ
ncbi:MAG TPA: 2Fe-2S iron-sulfur cluster-binding protein [Acetobacteraceae bacterium]